MQVALPPPPQMVLQPPRRSPREIEPALRTVVVRPDREELETLWVGSVPLERQPTDAELEMVRHAVSWKD